MKKLAKLLLFIALTLHSFGASQNFTEVVKQVYPGVVNIATNTDRKSKLVNPVDKILTAEETNKVKATFNSLGSGLIITEDGLVLTNNHLIQSTDEIIVSINENRKYKAELLGIDPATDLALLRIKTSDKFIPIKWGDSDKINEGEWVALIGNPYGINKVMREGIISSKGRSGIGLDSSDNFVQTSAKVDETNSGGALANLNGEVIGVPTNLISLYGDSKGIGYSIPSNMASRIVKNILKYGEVKRAYLGAVYQTNYTKLMAKEFGLDELKGALISSVPEVTPAETAGLKKGDIILAIDNHEIDNYKDAMSIISMYMPDKEVVLKVLRNKSIRKINVKLGESGRGLTGVGKSILGMKIATLTNKYRRKYKYPENIKGAVILEVTNGTLAALQGLREGMIILEVNNKSVKNLSELLRGISRVKQGNNIMIYVTTKDFGRYVLLKNY